MVFFTCSYCGESVKKASVSKHYLTKCRNKDPFLTCVDCLKDFKGTEYEAHTKCLTEEEKYSAKGSIPKASQNKGKQKQQAWQECIQTVLKKPTLKQDERNLIKAISKFDNVPRKKTKFVNFLTNAFKQYSSKNDLIDRVWVEMESVLKELSGNSNEEQKEGEITPNDQENAEKVESQGEETTGKKEKKRKRKAEESKVVETSESEKTNEKSKKKKTKHSEENAPAVEGNTEASPDDEKHSRKRKASENGEIEQNGSVADEAESGKKKKKKKHDKLADDQNSSQTAEQNDKGLPQKSKKKKKSKSEGVNSEEATKVAEATPVAENNAKSLKKAKKSENKENCAEKVQKEINAGENVEKAVEKKKKSESEDKQEAFDWKATILQVLNQEGKNKKIPLQKLQKKVLKLHCKILNCESSGKKEKKFLKKLKEMSQVKIEEDFVMLKS